MPDSAKPAAEQPAPLGKTYTPERHEPAVWQRWLDARAFHADPAKVLSGEKPPYCVLIPPPNVTAALHLGHALNNTIQDVLVRAHRMKGYETLWMPGTDHAGIATQTVVDRRLKEAGKPALADYKAKERAGENGRDEFIAQVQSWKDEYEARITDQLKAMGCSCDWDRQRFTMDEICARAVREAFFQLFKDGLIERGKRLVNWDPVTQTALSDDEVEPKEIEGHFYYLRYPLVHPTEPGNHDPVTWGELEAKGYPGADKFPEDDEAWITVATTRPETYLGDVAVAINPKDPRAEALRGLLVDLPLVGRTIPILEDDYVVLPVALGGDENDPKAKMATGFLKVTPAHDPNDWLLGLRHQETIESKCSAGTHLINVMAPDASISAEHGWADFEPHGAARVFVGLSREDARQKVVKEFQAHTINSQPLLEDIKPHTHSVGHSYRSHVPVEPYLSDQWYCRVTDDRLRGNAQRSLVAEQRTEASLQAWPESAPSSPSPDPRGTGFQPVSPPSPSSIPDTLTIHTRHLPHWQMGGSTYFITFRVAGGELSESERQQVLDACFHFHDDRMITRLVTVMPDHVHMIITPLERAEGEWWSLQDLVHSIKSFTATAINKSRGDSGPLWQDEYFDRLLRNEGEFREKWNYMLMNPVKAGLVEQAGEYGFTRRGEVSREAGSDGLEARPTRGGSGEGAHAGDGSMTFHPARYAKTYETWHDNLRDWCISRQLWWGHRIPVWHFNAGFGEGLDPWKDADIYRDALQQHLDDLRLATQCEDPIHCHVYVESGRQEFFLCTGGDQADALLTKFKDFISTGDNGEAEPLNRPDLWTDEQHKIARKIKYLIVSLSQDPDVLDTWFSSALWPLSTLGWPNHDLPLITPEKIDPLAHPNIRSVWVKRIGTFHDFIGTEGELSGELIEKLLHLRDTASTADGTQPLAYQLFSEKDLIEHGHDAQPLTKPEDIGEATDLICAVGVKATAPLENTKFGVVDIPALLLRHGFQDTAGLLAAFNPTSVLTTAREIITLWVSRMAMFNRYFLSSFPPIPSGTGFQPVSPNSSSPGPVPFHDVFIHAMIQDGEGRKMSKSLGNGVDPLDIIHSHGADAMRFTLVEMTTQTQDVRMPVETDPETGKNTSPKFDLGRNFCNKLWNAARFALSKLPSPDSPPPSGTGFQPVTPIAPTYLTLADRWMLTRLREGIAEIDRALATYQFSAYAKALYDLVRRDFCDWYLEAIKPTIADNPAQQGCLRLVLDSLLRLLHPVVPFITETIHERLSAVPAPTLEGLTLSPTEPGDVLATAGWPAVDASLADEDAKEKFERVRTIVDAIRAVRSANQVEPRRKVALHASESLAAEIADAAGLVESLAGLHTVTTNAPAGDSAAFSLDGVEHRLADLADALDPKAERERLEKEKADLEKSVKALAGRLSNPGYTEKAPAHLVQQTRDEHAKAEADLAAVNNALEALN